MPTKSLPTSSLATLTEDKTYVVPRAYFWMIILLTLHIAPWIVILLVVDDSYWAFGPLFGNMYQYYRMIFCKTVKFTLHANNTVTHYNSLGRLISCQTAVPLSKYERIRFNGTSRFVTFVKTDAYWDAIVANAGCLGRFVVCYEETYMIRAGDTQAFGFAHGFADNKDSFETA